MPGFAARRKLTALARFLSSARVKPSASAVAVVASLSNLPNRLSIRLWACAWESAFAVPSASIATLTAMMRRAVSGLPQL